MTEQQTELQVGAGAPTLELLDIERRPVRLAELWAARPTMFLFLRHFGCALCRDHLHQVRSIFPDVQARGGAVVAVASADPLAAAQFASAQHLPFPILADPARRAYRAFGLAEGNFLESFGPDVLVRQAAQALRGNIPYIRASGAEIAQLGGTFIVDTSGTIRFAHVARPIYNYPSVERYLAVFGELALNERASER